MNRLTTFRIVTKIVNDGLKPVQGAAACFSSSGSSSDSDVKKAKIPIGKLDDKWESKRESMEPQKPAGSGEEDAYAPFPENKNPKTGEIGGPRGPEPTRYGDWERKGRVIDF